jgi:diphosphate-dependent phosphofructokinase
VVSSSVGTGLRGRKDCVKRGVVREGQNPLQVAAEQLMRDGVDVLHTIGGDDTNTTAADLAAYLRRNNYQLTVIGLPKTIDNDVVPIRQSLGQGRPRSRARYFSSAWWPSITLIRGCSLSTR